VIRINIVCSWVIANVNAIAPALPTKIELNAPTHVGHAINNPVVAPTLLSPPSFLKKVKALTANAVLSPTRYETII
jgi:hypothetical protein